MDGALNQQAQERASLCGPGDLATLTQEVKLLIADEALARATPERSWSQLRRKLQSAES